MRFSGDHRKLNLGKRFRDSDNGLELTDSDGDRRANICGELGRVNLSADRDEVRGKLFSRLRRETGCTTSAINPVSKAALRDWQKKKKAYDLQ